MHHSSDGSTGDGIAVGTAASTDDARAVGGALTVCEVRVDGGDVEPKTAAQSPPRWRPSANDECFGLFVSGGPGLRPRFAPTLPAPRPDALIRAAAADDDAPIDALRRALTAELRDRKVRVDSLAAADAALGGGSASDVDATLRRDARFRRPGRDRPPAWVERLVAFVDDAPVFRTTAGVSDGEAGHPGAACTRETIGALERWVDASVRRVCRDGGGDASERANRAPAHPHNFITHGGGFARPSFDSFDAEAAAEGALWIYRVAFDELTEQVRRQCRDRGALLAKVWDHFFSVVEARAGLRYESLVADARVENIQTRAQLAKAKKEADALDAKRVELEEALAGERVALHRERTASSTAALAAKMRHRELRAEVDRLKTCDSEHRERLADSRVTERRLIADAEAARGRARDVAARLTREAEKVAVVEKRLAEETERAEGLKAELARVRAVVAERDRAVDALTTSLDDAARSLAREREGATALAGAFEECRAALEERTRVLDESNEANGTLREKIERCRLDADDLRSALGDARAQRDALELDLHDARACIATGCTREASLRTTVGQLSEEMIETRRAAENERVRRERESARADGATADAEAATVKWRMEREALRSELVGVRGVMRDLAGGVRTLDDLAEGILAEDLEAKSKENGSPCKKDGVTDDDASVESVAADIVRGAALARRVVERLGAHRKELGDAVRARDVARSRLYDAHDDVANLEREVADAKLKTLRLEKDVKERDGVIASRDREIAKLRSACAERVEDAKATAARLLAEETRSAELRSERCALEREVKRRAKIAEDLDACRVELEASEESRVGLTSVVEGLKAEREALEAGTRAAEGRIARLASNVEALEGDRMRLEQLVRSERSEHERAMRDERERLRASAKRGVDRATREWAKCEMRLAESEERLRKTRARASVTSRLKVGLLTRRCETLAVKLAASNVAAMAQRESFVRDMLAKEKATTELVREVRRAQLEWAAETSEAIAEVQSLRDDAASCVAASCAMRRETDGELREYRRRFATARDASQQCDDACVAHLVERARRQPRLFDESADSKGTSKGTPLLDARRVSRVIVETYLKRVQLAAGEAGRARDITHGACGLGALGNDTVHNALRRAFADAPRLFECHPSSAIESGSNTQQTDTLASAATSDEDAERAVDRVMASARHHARRGDAKCAAFCRFADCIDSDSRHADSDRRFASREAFHVFCSVLGCAMKAGFDDEFSVTLRNWRDGAATISTRVAMDVVANVYNTDAPRDVPVVRESLIRIRSEEFTTEGGREVGLDFDFFLSRIMEEYAAGRAPVNPMEAPRRVESAGL